MEILYNRYPKLLEVKESIDQTIELLTASYRAGGKLLLCGNGGSAADCDHIVGELMKGFLKKRPLEEAFRQKFSMFGKEEMAEYLQGSLPAISLVNEYALLSAFANDVHPDYIYAQQIIGLGEPGDILLAISTSGNSHNIKNAVIAAKVQEMKVIGLTGKAGSWLSENADIAIRVPEEETYKIQELHLPVYHWICASLEKRFFPSY